MPGSDVPRSELPKSGVPNSEFGATSRLAARAATRLIDSDATRDLGALATGTCLQGAASGLAGRSVLVATRAQRESGLALVELDGLVRRMVIAPPDLNPEHLAAIVEDAEIESIVCDEPERFAALDLPVTLIADAIVPAGALPRAHDTQWVLLTSGTLGRPKMVAHTLAALTGAIDGPPHDGKVVWSTFYDIRRYGGLQMFLRALLGKTDFVLTDAAEPLCDLLQRLGTAGVTAISGTPSHWRRVLMSNARGPFAPRYVRLSGEIADQMVLDGLRSAFPGVTIEHAYASTEAGVGFTVADGLEGFPAAYLYRDSAVAMKVEDDTLRIKSPRAASFYLGATAPVLTDADGYVDTGDVVKRRGDRYVFAGRRGGIINVGGLKVNPEEVEAAINAHAGVRMSLVHARKSPLTGAIVAADVVLRDGEADYGTLREEILEACRAQLERHKVPAILRFVPSLPLTPGGKLLRAQG